MTTGKPAIDSKIPSKSDCWNGRSRSSAARRPCSSEARIISWTTGSRSSPKNMCSVRQRPTPWAPNSRAFAASSGLSAFAHTWSRRTSSAHSRIVSKSSLIRGGTRSTSPTMTRPVPPSIVIVSPSCSNRPPRVIVFAALSMSRPSQPATQGLPMPRATTAACEVMPPCAVSTPLAWIIPWMSSGVVSQPTRMTASPALPRSSAVSASSTIAPDAAPGDAFSPRAATSKSAFGSSIGWSSWSSCFGSIRAIASSRLMRPSAVMSTAALIAAAAVRLAERVWSMYRCPSSTVNSMSCMSR